MSGILLTVSRGSGTSRAISGRLRSECGRDHRQGAPHREGRRELRDACSRCRDQPPVPACTLVPASSKSWTGCCPHSTKDLGSVSIASSTRLRGKRSLPSDAKWPPLAETISTTTSAMPMFSRMSRAVRWMRALAPVVSGFTTPPSTLVDASCLRCLFCLVLAMTSGTRHHWRAPYTLGIPVPERRRSGGERLSQSAVTHHHSRTHLPQPCVLERPCTGVRGGRAAGRALPSLSRGQGQRRHRSHHVRRIVQRLARFRFDLRADLCWRRQGDPGVQGALATRSPPWRGPNVPDHPHGPSHHLGFR